MNTSGISAVPGIIVGHAHCDTARTGVTLVLPAQPAVMAVDVRGGGPGTRETDALNPINLVERVHGLALAGGSVFGLAAGDELALLLSAAGRGLPMGGGVPPVPVVPAAILFDLSNGGDKAWGPEPERQPPYRRLTREAFAAAGQPGSDGHGAIGAGFGARAGSRAGGIGSVSRALESGHIVGALMAANSFGEVYPGAPPGNGPVAMPKLTAHHGFGRSNTIIGAVATNAPLTRVQALRVAMMAQGGLTRAVRPIHTPYDGDCIFAISTAAPGLTPVDDIQLIEIGTVAADLVATAVRQAVGLY